MGYSRREGMRQPLPTLKCQRLRAVSAASSGETEAGGAKLANPPRGRALALPAICVGVEILTDADARNLVIDRYGTLVCRARIRSYMNSYRRMQSSFYDRMALPLCHRRVPPSRPGEAYNIAADAPMAAAILLVKHVHRRVI